MKFDLSQINLTMLTASAALAAVLWWVGKGVEKYIGVYVLTREDKRKYDLDPKNTLNFFLFSRSIGTYFIRFSWPIILFSIVTITIYMQISGIIVAKSFMIAVIIWIIGSFIRRYVFISQNTRLHERFDPLDFIDDSLAASLLVLLRRVLWFSVLVATIYFARGESWSFTY
jgi:hypothetical protein